MKLTKNILKGYYTKIQMILSECLLCNKFNIILKVVVRTKSSRWL